MLILATEPIDGFIGLFRSIHNIPRTSTSLSFQRKVRYLQPSNAKIIALQEILERPGTDGREVMNIRLEIAEIAEYGFCVLTHRGEKAAIFPNYDRFPAIRQT